MKRKSYRSRITRRKYTRRSKRSSRKNRSRKKYTRRSKRSSRKNRSRKNRSRKNRSRRRSMKGGEIFTAKNTAGVGAFGGAAVGFAMGGNTAGKIAGTLGGTFVGAGLGAGTSALRGLRGDTISATNILIGDKPNHKDIYDPKYIGQLLNPRLQEIFVDRECPYDRDVFYTLFHPLKTHQGFKAMTGDVCKDFLSTSNKIWTQSDKTFTACQIIYCISVIGQNNTLFLSVIKGAYRDDTGFYFFTEVIPSYYLLTDMEECISRINGGNYQEHYLYNVYANVDMTCPEGNVLIDFPPEPELNRWRIPQNVSVEIHST